MAGLTNSKISQETAQQIINEFCDGASSYELADKYSLWQTSICNLISGRTWSKCQRPENIKELIEQRHTKGMFKKGMKCHIDAPPLTEFQMDVVVGSLLGDGSIKVGRANCSFTKNQCKKHKEYIDWHNGALQPYSSKVLEGYSDEKLIGGKKGVIARRVKVEKYLTDYRFYTHQHPVFTELRSKWYNERKIVPSDLVLNERRIAIWYWDDGCNSADSRQATLCTQSFAFDEVEFLRDKVNQFDLKPTIVKVWSDYTNRFMPILKFDGKYYDNLIHLVKPYMLWPCFAHKIKWRRALEQWETSGKFSEQEAKQVLELRKNKSAKEIAKMFNVHVNTIYAMVSGRSWKHLHKETAWPN